MAASPVVMLVDDQPMVAEAVRRLLGQQVQLEYCRDPGQALQRALEVRPSVVLVDLVMPEVDGLTLLRFFRAHPELQRVPLILLSSNDDPADKARAFEWGADDYLVKLPHQVELVARLRYHIEAYQSQCQRDEAYRALRESQRQLRETNQRLEEANQARSQFLAKMSHEVRTPINGILGVVDLLKRTELSSKQRDYAHLVERSGQILLTVINDILDFSKIEAGKLDLENVPVDLQELVEDVLELMAVTAHRKGLILAGLVERATPARVLGDPTRLRQILLNLVGNAIKFTESGEVSVVISGTPCDDGRTELAMEISDTGIGIDEEAQKKLFQAFSQADSSTTRRYGGTGLGLAIARHLAELMDGSLQLDSVVGQGSRFTTRVRLEVWNGTRPSAPWFKGMRVLVRVGHPLTRRVLQQLLQQVGISPDFVETAGERWDLALVDQPGDYPADRVVPLVPLGQEDPTAEALTRPIRASTLQQILVGSQGTSVAAPENHAVAGCRILLVEDNAVNQVVAQEVLELLGHTVEIAENGREAVDRLGQPESIDVVLMDCEMPEMDGYQATAELRRRGVRLPIIAMTAFAMQGDREKCLAAGMDDYVSKPFNADQVDALIRRWSQVASR